MDVQASIVIRTLNEERHLGRLLAAILDQTYADWEIVIVDSGSTDGTLAVAARFPTRIATISPEEFSFGRSLNRGCQEARGRYLVFVSAHTYPITNTWLANLLRPFEDPRIGMIYGAQRAGEPNTLSEERDLRHAYGDTSKILIDEALGNNANAAIRRELWQSDPFDESLPGLEDVEWAKRIQRKGYRVYYAADAGIVHIHEETLRQVYRRHFREALAYKRIFPRARLRIQDAVKLYVYAVTGDVLFAVGRRAPLRKAVGILPYRTVEWIGKYRGYHFDAVLTRELARRLYYPKVAHSLVIEGPGQHAVREAEVTPLGRDEVLIQVAYVGVCATDLEVLRGSLDYYRRDYARYPITPGHEFSGVIVGCGEGADSLRPGQRVVGECAIGCGECEHCRREEYYRCERRSEVGVVNMNGAYAQYLRLPARYVHRLPRGLSLKEAALVEPLAVCVKAVRRLNPRRGSDACVIGAGSIGNLCAQLLRSRGLNVTVVDPDPARLALLWKYQINTLTSLEHPTRFQYFVEASGNEEAIPELVERSPASARIVLLGLPYERPVPVTFGSVTSYDKEIIGSVASQRQDWIEAIALLRRGTIRVDDHTSVVLPLERYADAWRLQEERRQLKVLLAVSRELEGL